MPRRITRARLLVAGAGAALALPEVAGAATEDDLALLRLAASAELVTMAFYHRAKSSSAATSVDRRAFREALFADQRHYSLLVRAIGADAPVGEDFEIGFRRGTFASRSRIAEVGGRLERVVLGVHLNAASVLSTPELRLLAARLAASEGRHVALLASVAGGDLVGPPLADAIDVERASQLLAPYWGSE